MLFTHMTIDAGVVGAPVYGSHRQGFRIGQRRLDLALFLLISDVPLSTLSTPQTDLFVHHRSGPQYSHTCRPLNAAYFGNLPIYSIGDMLILGIS